MPTLEESKQAGNSLVALSKSYKEAIAEYTKGLDDPSNSPTDPVRHLVLGNRSLCHIELHDYKSALADALASVALNASFVKGWYRAGVAARALDENPDSVAEFFDKAVQLDPALLDAAMQRDEMWTLNQNRNYVEMTAICNTFSLLRQLWFDCGLREKVAAAAEASSQEIEATLKKVCSRCLLPDKASIESLDGTDAIHVAALLPHWNLKELSDSSSSFSSFALLAFINQNLTDCDTGFDLIQRCILDVQDKAQELPPAAAGSTKSAAATAGEADDPDVWFIQNCVMPSSLSSQESDEQHLRSAVGAKQHKGSEAYVYAMTGRPLCDVPGESFSERVARVRNLKSEHGIVPHKNRRLAVRTASLIVYDILLPLLREFAISPENADLVTSSIVPSNVHSYIVASPIDVIKSGVCACCLKKFVVNDKTGAHMNIVACNRCGASFYCSTKCREKANKDLGHHNIVVREIGADRSTPNKKKYACPAQLSGLARRFREDGNTMLSNITRAFFDVDESEVASTTVAAEGGMQIVANRDICTPETTDLVFKIPSAVSPCRAQCLAAIKRSTNWAQCEADAYGDGDQSDVDGQMPNQPGGMLQAAWGGGMDFHPTFLSQFMSWCMEGQIKKVSAALAALADDDERKRAVNRRESLLRLSPLHGCVAGARMHTGRVTADCDHFATARLLIQLGSSPTAKDIIGQSVAAHCATSYASDISLKILIYMCDNFPNDVTVNVQNRLGSWPYQESVMSRRGDVLRTLIMLGANPFKVDRIGTMMLIGPSAMTVPDLAETARKCLPSGGLRRGDLVAIHSLGRQKELNGVIGKIVERLVGGKYQLQIPDSDKKAAAAASRDDQSSNSTASVSVIPTKVVVISMENVTKAASCPNCDQLSLCHSLCTRCRESFCSDICCTSHTCSSSSSSTSSASAMIPNDPIVINLPSGADNLAQVSVPVQSTKAVAGARPPKDGEFFIVKASVSLPPPMSPQEMMSSMSPQQRERRRQDAAKSRMILLYDATQTVHHHLPRDRSNSSNAQSFDRLVKLVEDTPDFGGLKAFVWAVIDRKGKKIFIDPSVKAPPQPW